MNRKNACKVIIFTETWSIEEKARNNSLFLILNSSLFPHVKECSNKGEGGGVVMFIH